MLIAICRHRNAEPLTYLHGTLSRIATTPMSGLPELLPGAATPD